jgi:hypothetical protein
MKQRLIGLLPPATLLAVILFWAYAPKSVIDYPWTLTIVDRGRPGWLLEWLFERHADWRMNWREFFTDVFYVVLSSTSFRAPPISLPMRRSRRPRRIWAGHALAEHLPFLAQVGIIFALFEFGQYWMHRAMHNWTPLWLTHAPHHHITQLNALKGYVGNPLELFLISLGVIALLDFSPARSCARPAWAGGLRLCPCQRARRSAVVLFLLLHHPPSQPAPFGGL